MMKRMPILFAMVLCLSFGALPAQGYRLIYEQPMNPSGNAYVSALDPSYTLDYETADNFAGLSEPISKVVFYGVGGVFDGSNWIPGPLNPVEIFLIKFYNPALEPDWSDPVVGYSLAVTCTNIGTWNLSWGLYRFEVELPTPVPLASGWVSAQINSALGSGQWFLWLQGSGGDLLSHTRTLPAKEGTAPASLPPAMVPMQGSSPKELHQADMGYELYVYDATLPVELSSFTATLTAQMFVQLEWVAQSETNHLGYNVLRGESNSAAEAIRLNDMVISEGEQVGTQTSYSFTDSEVSEGATYHYWLESLDLGGGSAMHGPITILVTGEPGDHGIPPLLPIVNELLPAYPNPFNPSTSIPYQIKDPSQVRIEIYNARGQMMQLFERDHSEPGSYQVVWDGKDLGGREAPSGVYLYRMTAGKYTSSRKMVLAK